MTRSSRSLRLALAITAGLAATCATARPAGPAVASAGRGTAAASAGSGCPGGTVPAFDAAGLQATGCMPAARPESPAALIAGQTATARRSAPDGSVLPDAAAAAAAQRAAIVQAGRRLDGTDGTWHAYGHGPLIGDDSRFSRVANAGYADLNGRVNHFAYDGATGRLYATAGQGGVWALDRGATAWRSIGDTLPTQAMGGIAVSPAEGGTLLVITGNDVFGGGTTFAGLGAYRSVDGGATWQHASGVPNGVTGFQVAVDPTAPATVYVATGGGLFRSTDDGRTYTNVRLPVSPAGSTPNCTGADPSVEGCFLANMVTDVVVRTPGGVGADTSGGEVVAAVGWRAGAKTNTSAHYPSYVEAPGNGLYASATGAPGSFTKIDTTASKFADGNQSIIGRIELGAATGPTQDHGYLYAVVQDATGFQGGADVAGIDAPGVPATAAKRSTYLMGIYSSADFGQTWSRMATPSQLASPASGSSLTGLACDDPRQLYCPGIQSWYDAWIKPDPTRADSSGVPSRLLFGLEELWENRLADQNVGASGTTDFRVLASYIGGTECLFLVLSFPACPTTSQYGNTTLHADEHDGIFIPDGAGGVTVFTGNDGGVGTQHVGAGQALANSGWGRGMNAGFTTLMPYSAVMAKDGTVYAGLQDNGELRIEPATGKWFNTHDGDGTASAVDPDNSDIVFERPAGAVLQKSTDGGRTWTALTTSDTWAFNNPVSMDPVNSKHLLDAGNKVWESTDQATFTQVFSLGTAPGGASFAMSALDVRSAASGHALPTGPHTPDFTWTDGSGTVPSGTTGGPTGDVPGTYVDHPFTVGPNDGDSKATIHIQWASSTNDWDLEVYRNVGGTLTLVGSSTSANLQTGDPSETVVLSNPDPGDYVIRVVNSTATGTFDGSAVFVQRSAQVAAAGLDAAYVAYCGYCDALNTRPFLNGIATNVGGSQPPAPGTTQGWHVAAAKGLPQRFITSIASDPSDPNTVYVTLAGYARRWLPVGAVGENPDLRSGHVFRSTDAGATFTDISGNLPDAPAEATLVHNGNLVVATDTGVYESTGTAGGTYVVLGNGLPSAPVFSIGLKPKATAAEPDLLYVATHGRGVWTYSFATAGKTAPPPTIPTAAVAATPNTGAATNPAVPLLLAGMSVAVAGVATRRRRR